MAEKQKELVTEENTTKKMKKSERTKQKLLTVSEKEFAAKGFYGTRVDEIAARAGINKRMIYVYFGNKEALYMEVLRTVYKRQAENEKQFFAGEKNGAEAIREMVVLYHEFLSKNLSYVKLILWENLTGAHYIKKSGALEAKNPMLRGVEKLIRDGMKDGSFRTDLDVEQTIISLNMFCFSSFSNIHTMGMLTNRKLESADEVKKRAEHVAEIFVDYLTKKD